MHDAEQFTSAAWQSLKQQCCVNPETAVRCVMVSEEAFRAAMEKVLRERADSNEEECGGRRPPAKGNEGQVD
jgi:hypothetical protein